MEGKYHEVGGTFLSLGGPSFPCCELLNLLTTEPGEAGPWVMTACSQRWQSALVTLWGRTAASGSSSEFKRIILSPLGTEWGWPTRILEARTRPWPGQ